MNSTTHPQKRSISAIAWGLLALFLIGTEVFKMFPEAVEAYYAQGLYPPIGRSLRWLLGWLPFSLGDLLIGAWLLWGLVAMAKGIYRLLRRQTTWVGTAAKLKKCIFYVLWAYVLFYACWGFNYYRKGSSHLLQIQPGYYTTAEVHTLLGVLNRKLAVICADSAAIEAAKTNNRTQLAKEAVAAYGLASAQYGFMHFEHTSLKPNLLGPLQSYTGYGGYLFPYTGEAHVDFYVPSFALPFTVCHEMAHQQGFGSESEANMIGFLACRASQNKAFVYSAYADMQAYALRELWYRDSVQAKKYLPGIPPILRKDRDLLARHYASRQNPAQPLLHWVYHRYLLGTNQPEGLQSYNRVVAWLIAYGKKYGWDSI
jgi:hypothetical protein